MVIERIGKMGGRIGIQYASWKQVCILKLPESLYTSAGYTSSKTMINTKD